MSSVDTAVPHPVQSSAPWVGPREESWQSRNWWSGQWWRACPSARSSYTVERHSLGVWVCLTSYRALATSGRKRKHLLKHLFTSALLTGMCFSDFDSPRVCQQGNDGSTIKMPNELRTSIQMKTLYLCERHAARSGIC